MVGLPDFASSYNEIFQKDLMSYMISELYEDTRSDFRTKIQDTQSYLDSPELIKCHGSNSLSHKSSCSFRVGGLICLNLDWNLIVQVKLPYDMILIPVSYVLMSQWYNTSKFLQALYYQT